MRNYAKLPVFVLFVCAVQVSVAAGQETIFENAPKVTPNTTNEMQTPGFWISRLDGDPDEVILTPGQIARLNTETQHLPDKIKKMKDINGDSYSIDGVIKYNDITGAQYSVVDPLSITSFPGDSLRARLRTHREYFESRTYYDHRRMVFDDDKKNELYLMTDASSIPDVIIPMYGIITTQTNCRVLPTNEIAYGTPEQWYVRGLQAASCDVAIPVAVLHESRDKDWYYVRTEVSFGWVPAVDIAVGTPGEIRKYLESNNFIVAVEHKVPVYSDNTFSSFMTDIYMGSRIKLVNRTGKGYHVQVPFRMPDGKMRIVDGWVRSDAKVSVGYQPLTRRNMINTLFSLLYRPYAWNDAGDEWNCCGYIRVVLRTFGITVGSWPAFQIHYTDNVYAFPADTPRATKYRYLEKCDPGVCLLGSDGHINVYLGKVNGRYYVIHMGGYDYTEDDGKVMMFRRVNVNETELEGSYNVDDWTKISTLEQ